MKTISLRLAIMQKHTIKSLSKEVAWPHLQLMGIFEFNQNIAKIRDIKMLKSILMPETAN